MARNPIIFGLRDVVQGDGYIAGVAVDGRALLHEEDDGYVWVEGVNPGGFTGTGHSPTEALEEFRRAYTSILYDIALDVASFKEFKREVEALFANTGEQPEREWEEAPTATGSGRSSPATGWRSATVSSKRSSESPGLDRIEEDIPTTPEDVAALRRARERVGWRFSLERMNELQSPSWWTYPPRRRTSEGWEPFEL